jgi:hypothetical protein
VTHAQVVGQRDAQRPVEHGEDQADAEQPGAEDHLTVVAQRPGDGHREHDADARQRQAHPEQHAHEALAVGAGALRVLAQAERRHAQVGHRLDDRDQRHDRLVAAVVLGPEVAGDERGADQRRQQTGDEPAHAQGPSAHDETPRLGGVEDVADVGVGGVGLADRAAGHSPQA